MGVVGCAGGCQESMGFSPNKLVFGHAVCSPLAVLKGDCADTKPPSNLVDHESWFPTTFVCGGLYGTGEAECVTDENEAAV